MASSVLRTERLTKDFASGFWRATSFRALDDLSLEVPAGVVFGLVGPNGAGKSTTLNLLLNLLRPTSGTIDVLGRPSGDVSVRRRVGFLPEHPRFYDHLTPEELLTYFAGLFGLSGDERRRRVTWSLDRVGIAADRRRPLREHSKGMLQSVGIAQAIVNDPDLLILDEPMSGLDPFGRRTLGDLIRELSADGRTVLFSSHILSDVEQLCSEVAILARGRLVARGSVAALVAGRTLEDVFFEAVGAVGR